MFKHIAADHHLETGLRKRQRLAATVAVANLEALGYGVLARGFQRGFRGVNAGYLAANFGKFLAQNTASATNIQQRKCSRVKGQAAGQDVVKVVEAGWVNAGFE